jgi:GAF domain-containing protein
MGGHRRYTVDALRGLLKTTQRQHEKRPPIAEPHGAFQLMQFISDINSRTRAPDSALKEALRNLVLLLQMEMGAIYLRNDTGTLRLHATFGIPHWFLCAMAEVGSDSISGEVLRRRQTQVYDRQSCHDLPAQIEVGQGLCAPLIYQDEALGCVHIITRQQHQFFPGEINIVTTIAVYLASLVVNTQLLSQVQTRLRQLALLNQLSQAIETTTDLEPLLEIFLDETLRLVGEEFGTIHLVDETEQYLYLKTARRSPEWLYHMPVRTDVGIIGWMFQNMQPYYSPCLCTDPLLPPEFVEAVSALPTVSCLCLPMRTSNQIVGVFSINTAQPRSFTPDEIEVLLSASSEAAVAIHRARLLTAAKRNAEEQCQLSIAHAAVLDGLTTGVAALNADGVITVWNHTLEQISGISRERVLGADPRLAAPELAAVWAMLDHTRADGETRSTYARLPSGAEARFEVRAALGAEATLSALIEVVAPTATNSTERND